jgi:hypothetical protein
MSGETMELGNYIHWQTKRKAISLLNVSFLPLDLIVQWRRCGQTADYIASFLAYQFKDSGRAMIILSTIINELMENSVKFSVDKRQSSSFMSGFFGDVTILEATNRTDHIHVAKLLAFIERLLVEDLDDLFVAQIEESAEQLTTSAGLGLITLKKDYVGDMGFRIQQIPEKNLYEVTVQLHLDPDGMNND